MGVEFDSVLPPAGKPLTITFNVTIPDLDAPLTGLPVVDSFVIIPLSGSFIITILELTASVDAPDSINGYMVTEDGLPPSPTDPRWSAVAPTTYEVSDIGEHRLHAWARSSSGLVSAPVIAVGYVDVTRPIVTSFIAEDSKITTIVVTEFEAWDDKQVTGYIITLTDVEPELSDGSWTYPSPVSWDLAVGDGTHNLYAWARDEIGNISNYKLDSVLIDTIPPSITGYIVNNIAGSVDLPILFFNATDNFGVVYYIANEESTNEPDINDPNWSLTPPTIVTVEDRGAVLYTTYGWVRDQVGNTVRSDPYQTHIFLNRPQVTAFEVPATYASLTVPISVFTAICDADVTGPPWDQKQYMVTENDTVPDINDPGWSAADTPPTEYTVSQQGNTTLYAWVRDIASVGDALFTADVFIDSEVPSVSEFTVEPLSPDRTIAITAFSAIDNVAVTHYLVNQSNVAPPSPTDPNWSETPQTEYVVEGDNAQTLYGWAKDALDNISSGLGDTTYVDITPPVVDAFVLPDTHAGSLVIPITTYTVSDDYSSEANIEKLITTTPTEPDPGDAGWSTTYPTELTVPDFGTYTWYAWAKDEIGLISLSVSQTVEVTDLIIYVNDEFTTDRVAGTIDGTAAEPGPGTRTVLDPGATRVAIVGGRLEFTLPTAGWVSSAIFYDLVAREVGLAAITEYNMEGGTHQESMFGFTPTQTTFLQSNSFVFRTGGELKPFNGAWDGPLIKDWKVSTNYNLAVILRSTGAYYFMRGDNYSEWVMLYYDSLGNDTPVGGAVNNNAVTTLRADNLVVRPIPSILEKMIAYDDFSNPTTVIVDSSDNGYDGSLSGPGINALGFGGNEGIYFPYGNDLIDFLTAGFISDFNPDEYSYAVQFKMRSQQYAYDTHFNIAADIDNRMGLYSNGTLVAPTTYHHSGGVTVQIIANTAGTEYDWHGIGHTVSLSNTEFLGSFDGADRVPIVLNNAWGGTIVEATIGGSNTTANYVDANMKNFVITLNGVKATTTQLNFLTDVNSNITKSWLDTEFGVGNYVWYKLGETHKTLITGPDSQVLTQRAWMGKTPAILNGELKVYPDVGDELIVNGDFTNWTGGDPDGWGASGQVGNDPEISEVGDGEGHGGVGTGMVNMYSSATASQPHLNQNLAANVGLREFVRYEVDVNTVTEGFMTSGMLGSSGFAASFNLNAPGVYSMVLVPSNTVFNIRTHTTVPSDVTINRVSIKKVDMASTIAVLSDGITTDTIAKVDVTCVDGTQAGLVLALDSQSNPQNYIRVYQARFMGSSNRLYVEVVDSGVITPMSPYSAVYVPGAELQARLIGDELYVWYNGEQIVDETLTLPAGLGTLVGVFATDEGSRFDNFEVWPSGSNGEYAELGESDELIFDIYPGTLAVSPRQLSVNQINGVEINRLNDNENQIFPYVDGELDQAAIDAWLGGSTGYVKTLFDNSGFGRDFVQGTQGFMPVYTPNSQNGKVTYFFDGDTDDIASATTFDVINQDEYTYFIAFRVKEVGVAGGYTADGIVADSGGYFGLFSTEDNELSAYHWDGLEVYATHSPLIVDQWYIATIRYDGVNLELYVDDSETPIQTLAGLVDSGANFPVRIGAGSYRNTHMDFAEVLFYDTALSDEARQTIRDNINAYWNIYPKYPLDKYTATFGVSTRQLRTGQTNCLRLRRDSDDAESDFGFVNGELDTAAITTWLGGANGYVVTWYDQSGNDMHVTQSTESYQPLFVASGQNSKPVIYLDANNKYLTVSQPLFNFISDNAFTIFLAAKPTGFWGPDWIGQVLFGETAGYFAVQMQDDAVLGDVATTYVYDDSTKRARINATSGTFYLMRSQHDGVNINTQLNGVDGENTAVGNIGNMAGFVGIGRGNPASSFFAGDVSEIITYDTTLSEEDQQAIRDDINAYWNIY